MLQKCGHTGKSNYRLKLSVILMFLTIYGVEKLQCDHSNCEWNSERVVAMYRDFVFVRFHLLAFHFSEFRTCRTQPNSISRQTVEGSLGFAQAIKTSKVDRWFDLIGNQDCNWT